MPAWAAACVAEINLPTEYQYLPGRYLFNTNSALFGGVKKAKKPKNLGKILKMVPSESPKKADLNFQKKSLKVHFFIYLRPSEKQFTF